MSAPKILESSIKEQPIPLVGLPEYLLEKVKAAGRATFVIEFETEKKFTYEQYLDDVMKLAKVLKVAGLSPGDAFAVYGYNCYEIVVCFLAGITIGGIAMVIREESSAYDFEKHVQEQEVKFAFVSEAQRGNLASMKSKLPKVKEFFVFDFQEPLKGVKVVRTMINEQKERLAEEEIFKPQNPKETIAMYMLSSGTSGVTRACMMSHYALVAPNAAGIAKIRIINLGTPFSHVSAFFTYTCAVVNAATLITLQDWDPERLISCTKKYQLVMFYTIPANIVYFTKRQPPVDLSSVKAILYGGCPIPRSVTQELYEKFKCKFLSFYSTTEISATALATSGDLEMVGSLGKIQLMTKVKIVDPKTDEILGPNKEGEILVKGYAMFSGYHKDPKATKAAFDKDGYFRTGDIGYYTDQEIVYMLDRKKEFIYQGLCRVSPADIETLLMTHEAIRDVAVAGIGENTDAQKVYAFVVLKDSYKGKVTEDEIRRFANSRLSKVQQIEGGLVFVGHFPRTTTGKVIRKRLVENFLAIKRES